MVNELERLLSNAYSPYDNICSSCVVVMNDGNTFGGVCVKNPIYRWMISAEDVAISRAITAGYKKGDFDKIYIMTNEKTLNNLNFINKDVIIEFMGMSDLIYLYDINRNNKILKVGSLLDTIY